MSVGGHQSANCSRSGIAARPGAGRALGRRAVRLSATTTSPACGRRHGDRRPLRPVGRHDRAAQEPGRASSPRSAALPTTTSRCCSSVRRDGTRISRRGSAPATAASGLLGFVSRDELHALYGGRRGLLLPELARGLRPPGARSDDGRRAGGDVVGHRHRRSRRRCRHLRRSARSRRDRRRAGVDPRRRRQLAPTPERARERRRAARSRGPAPPTSPSRRTGRSRTVKRTLGRQPVVSGARRRRRHRGVRGACLAREWPRVRDDDLEVVAVRPRLVRRDATPISPRHSRRKRVALPANRALRVAAESTWLAAWKPAASRWCITSVGGCRR